MTTISPAQNLDFHKAFQNPSVTFVDNISLRLRLSIKLLCPLATLMSSTVYRSSLPWHVITWLMESLFPVQCYWKEFSIDWGQGGNERLLAEDMGAAASKREIHLQFSPDVPPLLGNSAREVQRSSVMIWGCEDGEDFQLHPTVGPARAISQAQTTSPKHSTWQSSRTTRYRNVLLPPPQVYRTHPCGGRKPSCV